MISSWWIFSDVLHLVQSVLRRSLSNSSSCTQVKTSGTVEPSSYCRSALPMCFWRLWPPSSHASMPLLQQLTSLQRACPSLIMKVRLTWAATGTCEAAQISPTQVKKESSVSRTGDTSRIKRCTRYCKTSTSDCACSRNGTSTLLSGSCDEFACPRCPTRASHNSSCSISRSTGRQTCASVGKLDIENTLSLSI